MKEIQQIKEDDQKFQLLPEMHHFMVNNHPTFFKRPLFEDHQWVNGHRVCRESGESHSPVLHVG
jgi:hypothetical protein